MAFDLSMTTLNHSSEISATIVHGLSLSCADMDTYSERLISAMQAAAVGAQQLARHLGVSIQAVNKAVDGKTSALSAPNNSKAARLLGVDSDWLATGEGSRVSEEAWPFKKVTLAQLRELERRSPGALEHIETTALGLLSLAKTPTNVKKEHTDTGVDDSEQDITVLYGQIPSKPGQPSAASTSTNRNLEPVKRRKRVQGDS